ncbi:uncharacterized protein LOC117891494 isoform X1 [Drosophila subobscura]|uniref:uncharacterized protein LOC117891494 isoform X1 n=1 Tax=Drosophila subobscura TaxID=7241 RepID=UPI00155AD2E8|nr:uncharacterized protein LOC117891494 isoform X1 [Drosophila subobscura]
MDRFTKQRELPVPMLLDRDCLRQVIATYMDKLSQNHPQATMGMGTPSPCFQREFSMLWYLDNFFDEIKHCFVECKAKISPEAEAYAACCKSRQQMEPQIKAQSDAIVNIEEDSEVRERRPFRFKPKWRIEHQQRLNKDQRDIEGLRRSQKLKSEAAKGVHASGPYRDPTPEPPAMQEPEENQEKNESYEKNLMNMFPHNKSTASIHTPFGKYIESGKTKEESHEAHDIFDKMLKSAAAVVSEHHPSLKSTHTLITAKDVTKLKERRPPHVPQKGHKDQAMMPQGRSSYTKPLKEMLQGKTFSEKVPLLKSSHRMHLGKDEDSKSRPRRDLRLQKRASGSAKNEDSSEQAASGLKTKPAGSPKHERDSNRKRTTGSQRQIGPKKRSKYSPKYELQTREGRNSVDSFASVNLETFIQERQKANADRERSLKHREKKVNITGPKFSKTFGKMLKGKAAAIPELHPALKSFHHMPTAIDEESTPPTRAHRSKHGKIISGIPAHIHAAKRMPAHAHKSRRRPMEASSDVSSIASILKPPSEFEDKPHQIKGLPDNKTWYKPIRTKFKSSGNIPRLGRQRFADYVPEKLIPYASHIDADVFHNLYVGEEGPQPTEENTQIKNFSFYIKNSKPDRKIMRREGSKHSIGYLSPTRSLLSRASWLSRKSSHSYTEKGSVISLMDMAKAVLPEQKKEVKEDEVFDELDFVFGNMPDPFLTEVNTPSPMLSVTTSRRHSKVVHRTENTSEERAMLEAKIKKLMEHCAIRQIHQPKAKRNFVAEAIHRTYLPPPHKHKKPDPSTAKQRPRDKFPITVELLRVPRAIKGPTVSERGRQKYLSEKSTEWDYPLLEPIKPLRIRRYSNRGSAFICMDKQLEHKKTLEELPKVDEREAGDSQAIDGDHCDCSICNRLGKHKREPDSPLIKRLKAQSRRLELRAYYRQMRRRELQKGLQTTPVECCPAQKASCC